MPWLSTTWTVETKNDDGNMQLYHDCEIALEEGWDGRPIMVKDGIVFLMALPKHLARPNSILSFNWYGNTIEVWEGLNKIGDLYLTKVQPLE